jgi:lipopolysaccharide/colanic/teichoic acid biosynthesis glycosyltransferase
MLIATWKGFHSPEDRDRESLAFDGATARTYSGLLDRPGYRFLAPARPIRVGPLTERIESDRVERFRELARRNVNVVAAVGLIILAAPLMVLIALLIRLTSPGPILFTQPRVGVDRRRDEPGAPVDPRRKVDHGGRIFQIYKFRTMRADADQDERQVWASPDDPRITRVGRFLRRYRLDELPQLFNVLRGDMNLVGPRPEQPQIFKVLRDEIDGYQKRQQVLPGITGLAQVYHKYDQSVDDVRRKVLLDLTYLERVSPLEDLRIMVRTVPVMLSGKGAI